jgi:hypothetical protein
MDPQQSKLSSDQLERLWKHRENALSHFHSLVNFTLVSQSVLIAVTGILLKEPKVSDIIKISLMLLGGIFTLLCLYIQAKQKFIIDGLKKRCEDEMPEYKEIRSWRKQSFFKVSNSFLIAYCMPLLFIMLWTIFFFAFITK